MKRKTILTGFLAIALTGFLAAGGCSKKEQPQQAAQAGAPHGQEAAAQQPPVNNATLIADLETKLKENPKDAEILWRLGDAYFDSRQFEQAVKSYKKVLDIKAGEADLYNDLGLSLHYLGNSPEGLKYIEDGIKKNPYHQRIWLTKGFILAYGMGDLDGAKAAWEKAAALNPESQTGKAASEYLALVNKK